MPKAPFDPLAYARRDVCLLIEGLLERIEELSVSDYPEATPGQVVAFLQDFLGELRLEVTKISSEERLKSFGSTVQYLGQALDWLDHAHTGQTPRGLVQVLRHLTGHTAPNTRVIVRPQAEYNYSIANLGQYFAWLVDNFVPPSRQSKFAEHLATPLKLVSFPRIERDNVLGHAIFGHELGHPVATAFLAEEEKSDAYLKRQTEVVGEVASYVDSTPETANESADRKLAIRAELMSIILQVRKRAMEELVSDAVGVLIFGPSAFFAMYDFLWPHSLDATPAPNEWYPPSRRRLRLMLDLLDRRKALESVFASPEGDTAAAYRLSIKGFVDRARDEVASETDKLAIAAIPPLKIAYEWMDASLGGAIEFAGAKTASIAFDCDAEAAHLPALIRRLELGVPPNEVGDPGQPAVVDYRTAMLAAWMFKVHGRKPATGEALSSKDIGGLRKQSMRAIEYVVLQNDYAAHMTRQTTGVA